MLPSHAVLGQVPRLDGWLGNWSGDEIGVVLIRWKNDLGMLHTAIKEDGCAAGTRSRALGLEA